MNFPKTSSVSRRANRLPLYTWLGLLVVLVLFACGETSTEVATPATLRVTVGHDGPAGLARLSLRSTLVDYGAVISFETPGRITLPVPVGKLQATLEIGEEPRNRNRFIIAPAGRGEDREGFLIEEGDDPVDIFVELGTASFDVELPPGLQLVNPINLIFVQQGRDGQSDTRYRFLSSPDSTEGTVHFELPRIVEGIYEFDGLFARNFSIRERCNTDSVRLQFSETAHLNVPAQQTFRGKLAFPWEMENLHEITFESSDELTTYPLTWDGNTATFEGDVHCFGSNTLWLPHPDSLEREILDISPDFSDPSTLDVEWKFAGLEIAIETDDDEHAFRLRAPNPFRSNSVLQTGSGVARILTSAGTVSLTYLPTAAGFMPPRQDWIEPGSGERWFELQPGEVRQGSWSIQSGGSISGVLSEPFLAGDRIGWSQSLVSDDNWPIDLEEDGKTFRLHHLPAGETRLFRWKSNRGNPWYYPGTFDFREREEVIVLEGKTVLGINF